MGSLVKRAEQFLGVPDFIRPRNFVFDENRGFYCVRIGTFDKKCMSDDKGRTHPYVKNELLQKLRDFFRPHNEKLRTLIKEDWTWLYS